MGHTDRAARPDCYAYVRSYYDVPAYVGMRVRVGIKEGALVKAPGADQYIHILFDGDKRPRGPYHPTDGITYLPPVTEAAP